MCGEYVRIYTYTYITYIYIYIFIYIYIYIYIYVFIIHNIDTCPQDRKSNTVLCDVSLFAGQIYIYSIYIYIYINFVCQVLMSKYIYKKLRHLYTKKLYFGFFQTFKDSITKSVKSTNLKTN